jgi:transglutaminase-like putative cysteine protease
VTRHSGDAATAALATILGVTPLTTLVQGQGWLVRAALLVAGVAFAGGLVRRFTTAASLVILAQLGALLLLATWVYAGELSWYGIPTPSSFAALVGLLRDFGTLVASSTAPLPASVATEAALSIASALVAICVDDIATTHEAPAAAGLPLLAVFLTAAANNGATMSPLYFLAAAGGWLILLARHGHMSMWRWSTTGAGPVTPTAALDPRRTAAVGFGSRARALGAATLLLALLVPAVLPHLPTRYVLDGLARSATGHGNAKVGFSSTLDVTRSLRAGDANQVLSYRTSASTGLPLRVLAATAYDGQSWSRPTPVLGKAAPLLLASSVPREERTLTVEDNTLDPPALATPQPVTAVDLGGVEWQVDQATTDFYVQARPTTYTVTYLEPTLTPALLRDGVDGQPGDDRLPVNRGLSSALVLDPASEALVRVRTAEVTDGTSSRYDAAVAIQDWLRNTGGFTYSLTLPVVDDSAGRAVDPVTAFLRTKTGYCVQFSTAMIMMARAAGIPARMGIGFLPGTARDGVYTVLSSDAHSWPELYFPGAGWVRFEPTPAARTGAAPAWTLPSAPQGTSSPSSTATSSAQPSGAVPPPERGLDPLDTEGAAEIQQPLKDQVVAWLSDLRHLVLLVLVVGLLGSVVLPVTAAVLRRSRAGGRHEGRVGHVEAQWAGLTSRLTDLGLPPPVGGTLRDCERHFTAAAYLDDPAEHALGVVVTTVETARYSRPGAAVDTDLRRPITLVSRAAARTRPRRQRVRAFLVPGDGVRWWRAARSAAGTRVDGLADRVLARLPHRRRQSK